MDVWVGRDNTKQSELCRSRQYPHPPTCTEGHWKFMGEGVTLKRSIERGVDIFWNNTLSIWTHNKDSLCFFPWLLSP